MARHRTLKWGNPRTLPGVAWPTILSQVRHKSLGLEGPPGCKDCWESSPRCVTTLLPGGSLIPMFHCLADSVVTTAAAVTPWGRLLEATGGNLWNSYVWRHVFCLELVLHAAT